MRVLVTGGSGFIGSSLVRRLLASDHGYEVTNLDALTYAANPASNDGPGADPRYRFVHADIRDARAVREACASCDAVVHLAAESHVDRSIALAAPFLSTNLLGTQTLALAAAEASIRRFVHVSTDEVYGPSPRDADAPRHPEDAPLAPSSPYAASKAASDHVVSALVHTAGLPAVIARPTNCFGPRQFPEKAIPLFATNLLRGQPIPLYGDGSQVRDWLHVDDCCDAIVALLERGETGTIYNAAGRNEHTNLELAHAVCEALDADPDRMITHVQDRPGHDARYAIDDERIRRDLGWRPTRSDWPDAIRETVEWYRANEPWWSDLLARRGTS